MNYDNHIIPRGYVGRRKVTALASLVQILCPVKVVPIHMNVKRKEQLAEIASKYNVDLTICTFDNIESRVLVRDWALESKIPTLFIGVTQNHVYIDWAEYIMLPETDEERRRVEDEMRRIRDVCSRIEFRPLGSLAASLAYLAVVKFIKDEVKIRYVVSIEDSKIHVCTLEVIR